MTEGFQIDLLDHGYLRFIESYGSDERIVEAARMSTNKGFQGWGPVACHYCGGMGNINRITGIEVCPTCGGTGTKPGDEKLLKYLYEHKHNTPFEMAGLIVEVKAPIMVFREWHRHRTQSYNEMSARYTPLPDENYVPTVERCMVGSGNNKQASAVKGVLPISAVEAEAWQRTLVSFYADAERMYQLGLYVGIPKELARLCVPVGRYSKMRAAANLRNWLAFMTLRSAPDAQYEIRVYSDAVGALVEKLFPRTWELFSMGRK